MEKTIINYLNELTKCFKSVVRIERRNNDIEIFDSGTYYMRVNVDSKSININVYGFDYYIFFDEMNSIKEIKELIKIFFSGGFEIINHISTKNKVVVKEILFYDNNYKKFNRKEKYSISLFSKVKNLVSHKGKSLIS